MNITLMKKEKVAFLSAYYEKLNPFRFFSKKETLLIHSLWTLLFCSLMMATNPSFAQVNIQTSRATAIYEIGEPITFQVTSNSSGTVSYEINYDNNLTPIETGSLNLIANVPQDVNIILTEPGVVFCKVTQWNNSTFVAASCAPLDIAPLEAEPADYDAFWNNQKANLAAVPMDAQVSFHENHPYSTTYKINLANIEGRRIYGYLSVPNGSGPFPAIISMPPAGNTANLVKPQDYMAERAGVLAFSLSVFDSPLHQVDPEGYEPNDITNREGIYYRYAILGAMRVIDYLESRDDYDGENMGIVGVSQGGGMSILVGGLDDRIKLIANSNPSHCQHVAYKYNKASPYPFYLKSANEEFSSPTAYEEIVQATKYYDATYAARRYTGPVLSITNYRDEVVPAATVYAALSQMTGPKIIMHATQLDHNTHPDQYWSGRFDFFRKFFPSTLQTAPWPWNPSTTGYFAEAGSPISTTAESPTPLNGTVELNGNPANFPVEWKVLSGPGNVYFSDENSANTSATFSDIGTYTLEFVAYDNTSLAGEEKFYTLTDQLVVNVTSGGGGPTTLNLTCPDDIVITLPEAETTIPVTWTSPTAFTTCPSGDAIVIQTDGLPSSSLFSEGTSSITYQASDYCNNTEACSFNITVQALPPVNNANYCASAATAPWIQWIAAVDFEHINQSSTKSTYSDFTDLSTEVNQNESYPITLSPGFSFTVFEEYWTVWIDFNQDGDFEDANEEVLRQNSNSTITENITIPANALLGATRMRVSMKNGGFATSCETFNEGEVEDYSIIITEGTVIEDTTPPTVILTTPSLTVEGSFVVTATFSEQITGLTTSDFNINNGTISDLNGNVDEFTFLVSPQVLGAISIQLAANTVVDTADNPNLASNELLVNYQQNANLSIICSNDINITLDENETNALVTWENPSAISTCSFGETTIVQTAGLPNASLFNIGQTTISYEATDECGSQSTCSFVVEVQATTSSTDYCESMASSPWLDWIGGVNLEDIYNLSGKAPYSDFTNLSTSLAQNGTYPMTLIPDFSFTVFEEYWTVWIDFNQDGDFEDANEQVLQLNSMETITENISIPSDALLGSTRMRVSMKRGDFATPCETFIAGEVEDYSILITEAIIEEDTTPPTVMLSTPSTDVYGDFAITVTFSEAITGLSIDDFNIVNGTASNLNGSGAEYMFLLSPDDYGTILIQLPANTVLDAASNENIASNNLTVNYIQVANLMVNCNNNITVTAATGASSAAVTWDEPSASSSCTIGETSVEQIEGATSGSLFPIGLTTISYIARDGCGNESICSFEINVLAGAPPLEYCESVGTSPWLEFISNVSFGDIDHTSFKETYGDFTNLSTVVELGQSYPIALSPDFSFTVYDEHWSVWIDFNQDSDFDDANELVLQLNGTGIIEGNINIPSDALTGRTRMRVSMKNGSFATACEMFNLGEVEDYSVDIEAGTTVPDDICLAVDLLSLNWNPLSGNNNLIYFSNTETASYTNTNGSRKGTELLFSDINFEPTISDLMELKINISNYTATNHELNFYISDGTEFTPLVDFSTSVGAGTQTYLIDLENYDRFVIIGEGISNGVSFATVELSELSIQCIDPQQRSETTELSNFNNQQLLYSIEKEDNEVLLKPNPARHQIQLSSRMKNPIQAVHLFNAQGQLIQQFDHLNHAAFDIHVHHLNKGVYWLKIKTQQGILTRKLLKI